MQMTVEAVKIKLGTHCGTTTSDMVLHLKDSSGKLVAVLTEQHRKLGFFSPQDGYENAPTLVIYRQRCLTIQLTFRSQYRTTCKHSSTLVPAVQVGAAHYRHKSKLTVSSGMA